MATGVPDGACMRDAGSVEEFSHTLNTVDSVVCVVIVIARYDSIRPPVNR
jgi:hypothetical protein